MANVKWIGTTLSRKLGLDIKFFSRFNSSEPNSLNNDISIEVEGGITWVTIPEDISRIINNAQYIPFKIEHNDASEYDYIFNITSRTNIGFWK